MKYITIIIFVLCISNVAIAQTEAAEDMMQADEFVEEEIKDVKWLTDKFFMLGDINKDQPVTVEYQFVNLSEEPIVITQVKSSCSCSVSAYTKEPIPKDGLGKITATYDAKAEGEFFKTFMLLTSKSKTPNVLVISGNVIAK